MTAVDSEWSYFDGPATALDASTLFDEYLLLSSRRRQPLQTRAARRKLKEALPARLGPAPRTCRGIGRHGHHC